MELVFPLLLIAGSTRPIDTVYKRHSNKLKFGHATRPFWWRHRPAVSGQAVIDPF